MQTYLPNKYHLVDLHKEIDLFDRKIAYCRRYEKFEYESERTAALAKLEKKRQSVVKLAMSFSSLGIEHDPKFLPRTLVVGSDGKITESREPSPASLNQE